MEGIRFLASDPMGNPNSPDRDWVRAALDRYERPLTLYAARMLGDPDAARDVVQDTFLRLCAQERDAIEPRLAEWLFTVCRNRALDVLRKESRMTQLSDDHARLRPAAEPGPDDVVETRESAAKAVRLLDSLPQSQREVIRLKFQNGFSYKEISRISGHSVGNVGYLIHVGLKTLRGQLAEGQPTTAQA
jgi:RNA polymerase sigma factor (sigma-70 family)